MPLRPIDAIFIYPKKRCYVVYNQGKLWILPRMKLDKTTWEYKKPFTENPKEIYLSSQQRLDDPDLAQALFTLELPESLHGSDVEKFEAWWLNHGLEWLNHAPNQTQTTASPPKKPTQTNAQPNQSPQIKPQKAEQQINQKPDPQPVQQPAQKPKPAPNTNNKTASGDVFEDMLDELNHELLG